MQDEEEKVEEVVAPGEETIPAEEPVVATPEEEKSEVAV